MSKSIYDTDFTEYLPEPLKRDKSIYAIAKAATDELLKVSGLSDLVLIYSRIDELPEDMLDILAYDFHCDWYDASYPVDIKRRLLKSNVIIHKRLGTKYAVERALTDIYQSAAVQEWFEYDGNPYFFKVNVTVNQYGISEEQIKDLVAKMWFYKNLRSHCDGFFYSLKANAPATVWAGATLTYGGHLKVKALLPSGPIAANSKIVAQDYLNIGGTMKIKPLLAKKISGEKSAERILSGITQSNEIKVKARTANRVKSDKAKIPTEAYQRAENKLSIKAKEV